MDPVRRVIGVGIVVAALVGVAWTAPSLDAQPPHEGPAREGGATPGTGLVLAGSSAIAGIHPLRAGGTPDPFSIAVRPVGALRAQDLRLGPGCRGFVTAQPDLIVRFSGATGLLRFFARSTEDVTLLVHDPSGRLRCNDDVLPGRSTNPMVDVYQPRPGQYDVWVGTRAPDARPSVTVFVTQSRDLQP